MLNNNRIQRAFEIEAKEDLAWKNECDSMFYEAEGYDPDAQKRYYMRPFISNEWDYSDYDFEEDEVF